MAPPLLAMRAAVAAPPASLLKNHGTKLLEVVLACQRFVPKRRGIPTTESTCHRAGTVAPRFCTPSMRDTANGFCRFRVSSMVEQAPIAFGEPVLAYVDAW